MEIKRYLPNDPPLDATIHAVVDGFNGGYQHEGDVVLSILKTCPEQFEAKRCHELHHVGAREVRGDDPFARLLSATSSEQDTADLVIVLLLEGLTIEYAQGGLSVYEAIPELADTIAEFREHERALFAELDEILRKIVTTNDPRTREALVESVVTDPEAALPPTHYLGTRMVQEISDVFGQDRVVDLVTSTTGILPAYQTAARETGAYLFTPETIDRITTAITKAEF